MTKAIKLTQGKITLVDDEDFEKLKEYNWQWNKRYVRRSVRSNGKRDAILMHRIIVNCPPDMFVDHINGDTLDNRRCNLRICTHAENMRNYRPKKLSTSSVYKGVTWEKDRKRWRAQIKFSQKNIKLGSFENEEDAAIAYNNAAKQLFGEFAYLNEVLP